MVSFLPICYSARHGMELSQRSKPFSVEAIELTTSFNLKQILIIPGMISSENTRLFQKSPLPQLPSSKKPSAVTSKFSSWLTPSMSTSCNKSRTSKVRSSSASPRKVSSSTKLKTKRRRRAATSQHKSPEANGSATLEDGVQRSSDHEYVQAERT